MLIIAGTITFDPAHTEAAKAAAAEMMAATCFRLSSLIVLPRIA